MSQLKTNTTTIQSIIDKLSGKSIENNDPNLNNTTISSNAATAADILSPKRAYVNGELLTGTMVDNGTVTKTLDTSTTSYTIPAGKHSGSGTVSISPQTKTATPSTSSQTITPDSGKVLSSVSVGAIPSTYVQPTSKQAGGTYTLNPGESVSRSAGTYLTSALSVTASAASGGGGYIGAAVTFKEATGLRLRFQVATANLIGYYVTTDYVEYPSSGECITGFFYIASSGKLFYESLQSDNNQFSANSTYSGRITTSILDAEIQINIDSGGDFYLDGNADYYLYPIYSK